MFLSLGLAWLNVSAKRKGFRRRVLKPGGKALLAAWREDSLQRNAEVEREIRHHVVMWLGAAGDGERQWAHRHVFTVGARRRIQRRAGFQAGGPGVTYGAALATTRRRNCGVDVRWHLRLQEV